MSKSCGRTACSRENMVLHGIVSEVVDTVNEHGAVFRHFLRGIACLKWSAGDDLLRPRLQMATQTSFGMICRKSGIQELSGAIYHHPYSDFRPIDFSWISGLSQDSYRDALHLD